MKLILAIALTLTFCNTRAQGADSIYVDTSVAADTFLYQPAGLAGSAAGVTDSIDYERKLHQNPTAALFKSMLVPGLGQIGNRQYVKAAVVIGLETWLVGSAIQHGQEASDFRKQFEASTVLADRNTFYGKYLASKDERNKFTWFAVIVTFVSMFDAFSDAHLSGFPKEQKGVTQATDLSIRPAGEKGVYASITYWF